METIFNHAKEKFIRIHGAAKYDKHYKAAQNSSLLSKLCGKSVQLRSVPTTGDFLATAGMMRSLIFNFDPAVTAITALIMLKMWNNDVNSQFQLCDNYYLREIALGILSSSKFFQY